MIFTRKLEHREYLTFRCYYLTRVFGMHTSVGTHNSTRIGEGRKRWNLVATKMQGTNCIGKGGEEPAMWPRIWVTTRREGEQKGEDNKRDEGKKYIPGIICTYITRSIYIVQVVKTRCRMGMICDYPSLFENIVLSCLQDLEDDVMAGPRRP